MRRLELSSTPEPEPVPTDGPSKPKSYSYSYSFFVNDELLIKFSSPPPSLAPYFNPLLKEARKSETQRATNSSSTDESSTSHSVVLSTGDVSLIPKGLMKEIVSSSDTLEVIIEKMLLEQDDSAPSSTEASPSPSRPASSLGGGRSRRGRSSRRSPRGSVRADVELSKNFGASGTPGIGNVVSLESDVSQIDKPRTPQSIKEAYEEKISSGKMLAITEPGLGGLIERIKTGYFFGFFEAAEDAIRNPQKKNENPWYLRPSITFPAAFAVVGLAFAVLILLGGISERGAMTTDELDDVVLRAPSIGQVIMDEAAKLQRTAAESADIDPSKDEDGKRERGAMTTDELDDVVLRSPSIGQVIMDEAAKQQRKAAESADITPIVT